MIVVSDASPIVALARIGRLDLLRDLYHRVLVPGAVHQEVRAGSAGIEAILAATWIEPHEAADQPLIDRLARQLDRGEAEAIALTIEYRADLLLMDERRGRRVAVEFGLRVVGTLAVLVAAKERGFVTAVAPLIDEMTQSGSFRVADDLRVRVLRAAGEESTGTR